jgi:hypothetical protein
MTDDDAKKALRRARGFFTGDGATAGAIDHALRAIEDRAALMERLTWVEFERDKALSGAATAARKHMRGE